MRMRIYIGNSQLFEWALEKVTLLGIRVCIKPQI